MLRKNQTNTSDQEGGLIKPGNSVDAGAEESVTSPVERETADTKPVDHATKPSSPEASSGNGVSPEAQQPAETKKVDVTIGVVDDDKSQPKKDQVSQSITVHKPLFITSMAAAYYRRSSRALSPKYVFSIRPEFLPRLVMMTTSAKSVELRGPPVYLEPSVKYELERMVTPVGSNYPDARPPGRRLNREMISWLFTQEAWLKRGIGTSMVGMIAKALLCCSFLGEIPEVFYVCSRLFRSKYRIDVDEEITMYSAANGSPALHDVSRRQHLEINYDQRWINRSVAALDLAVLYYLLDDGASDIPYGIHVVYAPVGWDPPTSAEMVGLLMRGMTPSMLHSRVCYWLEAFSPLITHGTIYSAVCAVISMFGFIDAPARDLIQGKDVVRDPAGKGISWHCRKMTWWGYVATENCFTEYRRHVPSSPTEPRDDAVDADTEVDSVISQTAPLKPPTKPKKKTAASSRARAGSIDVNVFDEALERVETAIPEDYPDRGNILGRSYVIIPKPPLLALTLLARGLMSTREDTPPEWCRPFAVLSDLLGSSIAASGTRTAMIFLTAMLDLSGIFSRVGCSPTHLAHSEHLIFHTDPDSILEHIACRAAYLNQAAEDCSVDRGFTFELSWHALRPDSRFRPDYAGNDTHYLRTLVEQTDFDPEFKIVVVRDLLPIDILPYYVGLFLGLEPDDAGTQLLSINQDISDTLQTYFDGTIFAPCSRDRTWGLTQHLVGLRSYGTSYPVLDWFRELGPFIINHEDNRSEATTMARLSTRTMSNRIVRTCPDPRWDRSWFTRFSPPRFAAQGDLDLLEMKPRLLPGRPAK